MKTPILDMLINYKETSPLSFHVPGHRNGKVLSQIHSMSIENKYDDYLIALNKLMELDVTELNITDDLHDPQGAIREAQRLAATLYGVKHSFFLVGGSTAGNIASILATCEPGDTIIVQRNAHKSVINGCKLAGVKVVLINPQLDNQSGYSTIPSLDVVKHAIKQYPHAKAVFLTSPNYYGMSVSLQHYVNVIHDNNMLLIVDEAHGAHYSFHPNVPQSAVNYGADLVVQSTHKTLPSLTMSAMLHVNTNKIDISHIQSQLAIIESSSPSFILLASLDIARAMMEQSGYFLIEQSILIRSKLIAFLIANDYQIVVEQYEHSNSFTLDENCSTQYDPLRLHIYDKRQQYSGYELLDLFASHGVWVEMATATHCILVLHLGYTEEEYDQLILRLEQVNQQLKTKQNINKNDSLKRVSSYYNSNAIGEPIIMTRVPSNNIELTDLDNAIGKQSGEMLVPYPPGIPILYEGETITAEIVEEINHYIEHEAKFQANETIYSRKIKIIMN